MDFAAKKIEQLKTADLVPYARNARTHSEAQVAQIAGSIREFGFTNPVLIDGERGIIAGHGRVLAAQSLGLETVPCIRLGHLTESQRRAYVLADNRLALNAGWDAEMLAVELDELKDAGVDLASLGFDKDELNELIGTPNTGPLPDPPIPPVPVTPKTVRGDIWLLGDHRLMCGDSTKPEDVSSLMDGRKALVMNTDPPYGIAYNSADVHANGVHYGEIENDDILDGEKLQAFLEDAIRAAVPHLSDRAAFYLWHPMLTQGTFFAAAAAADILIHRQIIWAKPVLVFGRGDYHWKHELCFYGWRRGFRPEFYGERNQTTLWEIAGVSQAERKEFAHGSPKPVELFRPPMENHTRFGDVVYEPFTGTGPQIICAELLGRVCCGMELAPQYVDVSIIRWQNHTGKKAIHAVTGEEFNART